MRDCIIKSTTWYVWKKSVFIGLGLAQDRICDTGGVISLWHLELCPKVEQILKTKKAKKMGLETSKVNNWMKGALGHVYTNIY